MQCITFVIRITTGNKNKKVDIYVQRNEKLIDLEQHQN
jgi:hypothetical protein